MSKDKEDKSLMDKDNVKRGAENQGEGVSGLRNVK